MDTYNSVFAGSFSEKDFINKWEFTSPRNELMPLFYKGDLEIAIEGNGNPYVLGYWKLNADVQGGKSYRLKVKFKVDNIDDINLHVLNVMVWKIKNRDLMGCPCDQVTYYYRDDGYIIGEQCFETAKDVSGVEVQLGLRYIKSGKVSWYEASLTEVEHENSHTIHATAVKWNSQTCGSVKENHLQIEELLNQAGALRSDLVLLPEFSNYYSSELQYEDAAEMVPDGLTCQMLSKKAKEYKMNVCAGIIERDGDYIFNTAVLFDRTGNFAGKYRKVHLYWPEAVFHGESPGDEHPVFDLDIGKIGIIICYDSWYPESARILSLKGAELILFPNAGYEPLLIPARAIDNGTYFMVSSLNCASMIVNTRGEILAQTLDGIISTKIDLSKRPHSCPNAGGSMNSSPGGRRGVRNSMSGRLYEEIKNEVENWEKRYEKHTWL